MGPVAIHLDPVIVHSGAFCHPLVRSGRTGRGGGGPLARRAGGDAQAPAQGIIVDLAIRVMPGGLIGARQLHVIDRWPTYLANPVAALATTEGGLAIQGAVLGGLLPGRSRFGAAAWLYLVLYGTGKFLVSFARAESIWLAGLQQAHLIAAMLVLAGMA